MLNLTDPPQSPPPEDHPHLRLVPKGPPVRFRVPEDPEVPWWIRTVAISLGVIISVTAVVAIIFFGSFIKHVYDTIDAAQKARAAERRAAPRGTAGTIPIVIPKDQPTADDSGETAAPEGSDQDKAPAGEESSVAPPGGDATPGKSPLEDEKTDSPPP